MKMTKNKIILTLIAAIIFCFCGCAKTQNTEYDNQTSQLQNGAQNKLAVLWTSGDPDVAEKVCFMYTHNAKKAAWFDHVQLIVWGPSAKLLSENESLQTQVKTMIKDGVIVTACKACADSYNVSDKLTALGIDVKYMGKPLSKMLKSNTKVITF